MSFLRAGIGGFLTWSVVEEPEIKTCTLTATTRFLHLPPPKTNMTMENQHFKIYFLVKIGNFQCHLSFQGCNLTGIGHFVSAREGNFF